MLYFHRNRERKIYILLTYIVIFLPLLIYWDKVNIKIFFYCCVKCIIKAFLNLCRYFARVYCFALIFCAFLLYLFAVLSFGLFVVVGLCFCRCCSAAVCVFKFVCNTVQRPLHRVYIGEGAPYITRLRLRLPLEKKF